MRNIVIKDLYEIGNFEDAALEMLRDYNQSKNHKFRMPRWNVAEAYLRLNRYDRAITLATIQINLRPCDLDHSTFILGYSTPAVYYDTKYTALSHQTRAFARALCGDTEGAIEDIVEVIKSGYFVADSYNNLGEIHFLRGEIEDAKKTFEKAFSESKTPEEKEYSARNLLSILEVFCETNDARTPMLKELIGLTV